MSASHRDEPAYRGTRSGSVVRNPDAPPASAGRPPIRLGGLKGGFDGAVQEGIQLNFVNIGAAAIGVASRLPCRPRLRSAQGAYLPNKGSTLGPLDEP